MPDTTKITAGPAQVLLADNEIGHTAGGVELSIKPSNRMRNVDQYGSSGVDVIHTGDDVHVKCPFAEWTAAVLGNFYNPGLTTAVSATTSGYVGIGRSAGFIYVPADLKVIPRLTANAGKRFQAYRAVPIGEVKLPFKAEEDRIFECDFACLVDPAKTDGELIGKLYNTYS